MVEYLFFKINEAGRKRLIEKKTQGEAALKRFKENLGIEFSTATPGKGPYNPSKVPEGVELTEDLYIKDTGLGSKILKYWRTAVDSIVITTLSVWDHLNCKFPAPVFGNPENPVSGPDDCIFLGNDIYIMTRTPAVMPTEYFEKIDANAYYAKKSEWLNEVLASMAGVER